MESICKVDYDGTKFYYNEQGQLHRVNAPAIVWADGTKMYYRNGLRHRKNGPAVVGDGFCEWWIDGKQLSEYEFDQMTAPKKKFAGYRLVDANDNFIGLFNF